MKTDKPMTPEQLTEQTIATFAAWKKDPKTPIEMLTDGKWEPACGSSWGTMHYRIKPFTLGNSINGHTLGDGEQWHRLEGWTADMLPAPYRPLILGEDCTGAENLDAAGWVKDHLTGVKATESWRKHRTTRPLPSAQLAPGHNPDRLSCAQVGTADGWRLLEENEGLRQYRNQKWWKHVQLLAGSVFKDTNIMAATTGGVWCGEPCRTRLTREELAALDAPKFRPFTFDEVPLTPKVKRKADGKKFAARHSASTDRFVVDKAYYGYEAMLDLFTFLDGAPFGVEVK